MSIPHVRKLYCDPSLLQQFYLQSRFGNIKQVKRPYLSGSFNKTAFFLDKSSNKTKRERLFSPNVRKALSDNILEVNPSIVLACFLFMLATSKVLSCCNHISLIRQSLLFFFSIAGQYVDS